MFDSPDVPDAPLSVPAFIEVEPDSFKPFAECSRRELLAAAERHMIHGLMMMREAIESEEQDGSNNTVAAEIVAKAREQHDLGVAIHEVVERSWSDT